MSCHLYCTQMIDEQTAELKHIVCYRLTLIHLTFHGFSYIFSSCVLIWHLQVSSFIKQSTELIQCASTKGGFTQNNVLCLHSRRSSWRLRILSKSPSPKLPWLPCWSIGYKIHCFATWWFSHFLLYSSSETVLVKSKNTFKKLVVICPSRLTSYAPPDLQITSAPRVLRACFVHFQLPHIAQSWVSVYNSETQQQQLCIRSVV